MVSTTSDSFARSTHIDKTKSGWRYNHATCYLADDFLSTFLWVLPENRIEGLAVALHIFILGHTGHDPCSWNITAEVSLFEEVANSTKLFEF